MWKKHRDTLQPIDFGSLISSLDYSDKVKKAPRPGFLILFSVFQFGNFHSRLWVYDAKLPHHKHPIYKNPHKWHSKPMPYHLNPILPDTDFQEARTKNYPQDYFAERHSRTKKPIESLQAMIPRPRQNS